MNKRRAKPALQGGGSAARKASSILGDSSVANGMGSIPANALPDVHDDFADLRDIDFSQYIAGDDDHAGSMNSPSSPSVGMMSKTPFKSPVPSEFADDPIEVESSPPRPLKLRDYLPGLGSSVEPSFRVDDSQQTRVIPKGTAGKTVASKEQTHYSYTLEVSDGEDVLADVESCKVPADPKPRHSYTLEVSDGEDVLADAETCKLPDIEPGSPAIEVAAPSEAKKAAKTRKVSPRKKVSPPKVSQPKVSPPKVSPQKVSPPKVSPPKVSPPKRVTRNRKVNGKKKPETTRDDSPAARNKKAASKKKKPEVAQDDSLAAGHAKGANGKKPEITPDDSSPADNANGENGKKKPQITREDAPAEDDPRYETPPKRPLLARMLSVLSEPGSLKWENPLVGGHLQSPDESDGSQMLFPSSPSSAVIQGTARPMDDEGSIYSPSIPASWAEPFELSQSLGCERPRDAPPVGPKKNQVSPIPRLVPDAIEQDLPGGSPAKSPVKGAKKGRVSPEKRGREAQKATAPSKRRRVQEPVKKRVVQPRAKAKGPPAHEAKGKGTRVLELDNELTASIIDTRETGHTGVVDVPRTSRSKAKGADAHNMEDGFAVPVPDTHEPGPIADVPRTNRSKVRGAHAREGHEVAGPVTDTHKPGHNGITDMPRTNSRTMVSETGSPTRIDLSGEASSPAGDSTNSPSTLKKAAADSPEETAPSTQPPVTLKAVFQPQLSRPRETGQVDSPHPRQKIVTSRPATGSRVLASRGRPSKPSGREEMTTNGKNVLREVLKDVHPSQQNSAARVSPSKPSGVGKQKQKGKNVPRDAIRNTQPVPSSQQNPSFEAFRQHIMGQLTTIEARQQHDEPSDGSDGPNDPKAETVKRAAINIVPQHILGGVLSAMTEKTIEYVKSKEKALDGIAQEYQSGGTAFIDKVEKLHRAESLGMVKTLKKQRQSFVESCEIGTKTCEGLVDKLEQCSLSGRRSGLEGWLGQGREMQKQLQGTGTGRA